MNLTHTRSEDVEAGSVVYFMSGSIDGASSDRFHDIITGYQPDKFSSLNIDLQDVDFVSSAGLRAFVKIIRWCKELEVSFWVSNANAAVWNVFELAQILSKRAQAE